MDQDYETVVGSYAIFLVSFYCVHSIYLGRLQAFYFTVIVTFLSAIILFAIEMAFEGVNFHEELRTGIDLQENNAVTTNAKINKLR
jgi:hypothetical protein